jgi:hypothetical protein
MNTETISSSPPSPPVSSIEVLPDPVSGLKGGGRSKYVMDFLEKRLTKAYGFGATFVRTSGASKQLGR